MSAPIIAFRQRAGGHGAVRRQPLFLGSNVVLAHFNLVNMMLGNILHDNRNQRRHAFNCMTRIA